MRHAFQEKPIILLFTYNRSSTVSVTGNKLYFLENKLVFVCNLIHVFKVTNYLREKYGLRF